MSSGCPLIPSTCVYCSFNSLLELFEVVRLYVAHDENIVGSNKLVTDTSISFMTLEIESDDLLKDVAFVNNSYIKLTSREFGADASPNVPAAETAQLIVVGAAVGNAVGIDAVLAVGIELGFVVSFADSFEEERAVGPEDGFAEGCTTGFDDDFDVGLAVTSVHFLGVISVALRPMPAVLLPYTDIQSDAFHTNFGVKRPATRSARPYWKK